MGAQFDYPMLKLPENELAWTATDRLLDLDAEEAPPLLFLHGPSGVGKSHLIIHLLREWLPAVEPLKYRLLSMHEFATLNMEAPAAESSGESLRSLGQLDLLVCEGLQHLDQQPWLQKKLISLFDQLQGTSARVVITSQMPIGAYDQVLPKLVSRCRGGVTATISLPGESSRARLLRHFAEIHGLTLDDELTRSLARQLPVTPRELQGCIVQLEALQRHQTLPLTADTIQDFLSMQQPRQPPTMMEVARSVAREFGVSVQAIRSAAREQSLLIPRQVAMLLSRELIQANYADIGAYYGGRSHSTVMHACRALLEKSQQSPELDYRLCQLRRLLQGLSTNSR